MMNFRSPTARSHNRTPVVIDVAVNGVLNFIDGQITDLSESGARIDGASMPARSRCEIHYAGEVTYAIVMWSECDRMGVHFPYELTHGALYNALKRAQSAATVVVPPVFPGQRTASFGRRGLS